MTLKINDSLKYSENLALLVAIVTAMFATLYHLCIMLFFCKFKVIPMIHFNLFSFPFFLASSLFLIFKKKWIFPIYIIAIIEVVLHQIFSMYFIGGKSGFHYLILIMMVIPFIVFNNKKRRAVPFSILCALTFISIEGSRSRFTEHYPISEYVIKCINYTNLTLSIAVVLLSITIYSIATKDLEDTLNNKVKKLVNSMTYAQDKIISIQTNTIIGLSSLVENRDGDTGKHIQRTSAYVGMLARAARDEGLYRNELTEDYIEILEESALMHDIGKIVVADSILKKKGPLTDEERADMQKHTVEGHRIVKEILGNAAEEKHVETAAEIAHYHHEWWDGSVKGYPEHLKEKDIPLSARIMAIADVFDALVSPRCYKDPMSVGDASYIIRKEAGTHFDPELAKVFLRNIEKAKEIMNQYQD